MWQLARFGEDLDGEKRKPDAEQENKDVLTDVGGMPLFLERDVAACKGVEVAEPTLDEMLDLASEGELSYVVVSPSFKPQEGCEVHRLFHFAIDLTSTYNLTTTSLRFTTPLLAMV